MAIEVIGDERDRKRAGQIVEAKELKARAERGDSDAAKALTRRISELDRTVLANPNPAKVYRMADGDRKGRVGQLKGMGYTVTALGDKCQAVQGYEVDGAQRVGSMLLMETTRENYEKRKRDKQLIADLQTGGIFERAKENINKAARDGNFIAEGEEIAFDNSGDSKS